MTDLNAHIVGADKVISLFGYWPSFHDAEVIELSLHRGSRGASAPTLTARIHVFEMTSEISAGGTYVCRNHCVVTFRFTSLETLRFDGFNHQNVLDGITITVTAPAAAIEVAFESVFGVDASFVCRTIEILDLESIVPEGSVYPQK